MADDLNDRELPDQAQVMALLQKGGFEFEPCEITWEARILVLDGSSMGKIDPYSNK